MRTLLETVIKTRREADEVKARLTEAERVRDAAEHELLEAMESQGLKSLDFDDLGRATIGKPRLYASCPKEHQDRLFNYLDDECGRGDLIKKTVFPATLSSFVSEKFESGEKVPEFISTYLKPSLIIRPK